MTINVRVRDGMCPDPTTGDGGATEGDIRGSFSDIIDVVGVKDLAGGHCAVTENSPAALSVLVAPGIVYIPNADYDELDSNQVRFWEAIVTVSTAVTITANTSGSARVDLVCAKMDTTITPDEHASNIATLVAVAGTPGAGTPATPDNHYVLATVAVANGASTIVNANITSTRVQSKIDFDFLPKATGAEINTGTEDAKIVTPKAIADSKLSFIDGTETLTNKTLTSPVLTTPQINDTTADHQYITAVSELEADRTVTLPLLTGNDEFVFKDHAQTLTNKTLTSPRQTNDIKFRVSRNAAANTGNGAFAVINYDTEQYDTGEDVASGVFTAPLSGYYTFSWGVAVTCDGTAKIVGASLFINGSEYSRGMFVTITASTESVLSGSDTVYIASGQTAEIRAYAAAILPLAVGNTTKNWFSGRYISS